MLELFELTRWEGELVESFSHGMKQRLVMCAAFLHRPRAVLVDEPMVGLDPRGARLIKDVFRAHEPRGRGHPDEHAHPRGGPGDVRPHQHHPASGRSSPAARWTSCWPLAGGEDEQLTPVFLKLTGGSRPAGDRGGAVTDAAARSRSCCCPPCGAARNRARRREQGDGARAALFGGIGLVVGGVAIFGDRLLAHLAAPRLRGAGRLPDPAGAVLALPDLPLLPRLQRHRHRRSPRSSSPRTCACCWPRPSRADRLFYSRFARTVGQASLDGGDLPGPGAARRRPRPLRRRRSTTSRPCSPSSPFVVIPVALGLRWSPWCSSTSSPPAARATS